MNIGLIDIFVVTFLLLLSLSLIVTMPSRRNRKMAKERFEKYVLELQTKKDEQDVGKITITRDQFSNIPALNQILNQFNAAARLRRLLEQAGLQMNVGSLLLLMVFFSSVSFLFALRMENIGFAILITIGGGFLPIFWVVRKKKRRLKKFDKHFPDAVDLMTSALRAGLSFVGALKLVGQEAPEPINQELMKTYEEQSLGIPIEESLEHLTQRIQSLDLKFFVTALLIQRDIGGNLTELLENISHTIRDRFKLMGQVKAQTAQGRFTGWMLTAMPFIMAGIISVLNPEYIKLLFTEKIGHYMIYGALFMQLLGFLVIRKVVNIKA